MRYTSSSIKNATSDSQMSFHGMVCLYNNFLFLFYQNHMLIIWIYILLPCLKRNNKIIMNKMSHLNHQDNPTHSMLQRNKSKCRDQSACNGVIIFLTKFIADNGNNTTPISSKNWKLMHIFSTKKKKKSFLGAV